MGRWVSKRRNRGGNPVVSRRIISRPSGGGGRLSTTSNTASPTPPGQAWKQRRNRASRVSPSTLPRPGMRASSSVTASKTMASKPWLASSHHTPPGKVALAPWA